ncbi:MAG: phosphoribosylformylglycinamidine synthase subunit PurL [Anaerolineae bacterium]|nr:phosphoribosylformylglycinamidine synthase subunit PurL [Anaerolineae bacterium]
MNISQMENSIFRIEVRPRSLVNTANDGLVNAAHQLGLTDLRRCVTENLFFVQGQLSQADLDRMAQTLLADPVTESFRVVEQGQPAEPSISADHFIEVTLLPGVTDPAAENLVRAAHLLGLTNLTQAATGRRYWLDGPLTEPDLHRLAVEIFSNPVIQRAALNRPIDAPFVPTEPPGELVEVISLRDAADDDLLAISATRRLALNLAEMQAVRAYYQQENRDPTDVELEMLAQTWSEHCVHKTFKATITYTGPRPGAAPTSPPETQTIDGLLKSYIRAATDRLAKPWIRSTFVDNAGIIAFDDTWDLAFKVETHNHPSALEPFGGANTGVGGVVRDILGVSARPIANTDVLCFGPPDLAHDDLPAGVLHPRRIADGVIHGVEDYGNKMGIPTVNGAILYHPGYTANPLVFCGCLGLLPHNSHPTGAEPGDLIVVIGGRTGRDGLRGATFSSMEMDQTTGQIAGSAVQIGHPIHEKQVLEVVLRTRDEQLYHAVTDCGAGGLSSAVGEMSEGVGAQVQLETVPLKYPGLTPWEIWLSEAQERMVFAVAPDNWPRFQEICAGQDVEAVAIGQFEASGRLQLFYNEQQVGDLALDFLHDGLPLGTLEAMWTPPQLEAVPTPVKTTSGNLTETLLAMLAHPNVRSKEAVVRRYDHEVQGGTAVKPLVGVDNHGPGDATVLVPLDVQGAPGPAAPRGVALSAGVCPAYGELDPYAMAWAAIDEAMRNLVAVGADPTQVAILDNFCWGNPNLPDRLGSLVRCAQGCYDAALAYEAPFISGKDSLNNEYLGADGQKHAIPGTLLISAVGLVPDVSKTVTMDLKQPGNLLYLIGDTRPELGGSLYHELSEASLTPAELQPPQPVAGALTRLQAIHRAMAVNLIQTCHDCSEGGLAVALAEMSLAGRLGAEVILTGLAGALDLSDVAALFSESLNRFIIEVRPDDARTLEKILVNVPLIQIGYITAAPTVTIQGQNGQTLISADIVTLETTWRSAETHSPTPNISTPQPLESPTLNAPTPQRSNAPTPQLKKRPKVLVLHANGTNRDREAALACQLAGADPEIVHVNQLLAGERRLLDYPMFVVPGGFSYGDDLGAGTLWSVDLKYRLGDDLARFVESGRPVLGICNGFQVLVKAGLLPGVTFDGANQRSVTLAHNELARFECRWVYLQPNPASPSLFTAGLTEPIYCPVAHGEGRIAVCDDETLASVQSQNLNALTYINADGSPGAYPANPNGSAGAIAGLCNPAGNVLGLMPHPEDHVFPWQHPRRHRGEGGQIGLRLFENGVRHA